MDFKKRSQIRCRIESREDTESALKALIIDLSLLVRAYNQIVRLAIASAERSSIAHLTEIETTSFYRFAVKSNISHPKTNHSFQYSRIRVFN